MIVDSHQLRIDSNGRRKVGRKGATYPCSASQYRRLAVERRMRHDYFAGYFEASHHLVVSSYRLWMEAIAAARFPKVGNHARMEDDQAFLDSRCQKATDDDWCKRALGHTGSCVGGWDEADNLLEDCYED